MKAVDKSGTRDGVEPWLEKARERFAGDLERKVLAVAPDFKLDEHQQHCFDEVVRALSKERVLQLSYKSIVGNVRTEVVEPWSLLSWRGRLYLVVAEHGAETKKPTMRRLDRIADAEVLRPRFEYPEKLSYDPAELAAASLGPFLRDERLPIERVELRFEGVDAKYHRNFAWPVPHTIVQDDPLIIALDVQLDFGLKRFLLRLGAGVEVLKPAKLREEIAEALRAAARKYD
jgi:predicted DNA-binding transcriptional regulator YafY